MNYYKKLQAKVKILEMICRKHSISLEAEPLYVKFLSGKVERPGDIFLNNDIKSFQDPTVFSVND